MKFRGFITAVLLLVALAASVLGIVFCHTNHLGGERTQMTAGDYVELGKTYYEEGEYFRAIDSLQQALSLEGDNAEALRQESYCYEAMGYSSEEEEVLENLCRREDRTADDFYALIKCKIRNGKEEEARKLVKKEQGSGEDSRLASLYKDMDVKEPVFNLKGGSYDEYQLLTLTEIPENATVYYTLDGTDPTADSRVYEDGIVISAPETNVRARTISDLGYQSQVVSLDFHITKAVESILIRKRADYDSFLNDLRYGMQRDYDDPFYNYELAQIRELYIIGFYTETEEPEDVEFYENGYLRNGSFYDDETHHTFDKLQYFPFLKKLAVGYQRSFSMKDLSGLEYLEELSLLHNNISNISAIAELKSLKKLCLGWNKISDASAIGELRQLESLGLWNNEIMDINFVSSLKNLQYLDLSHNKVNSLKPVGELKELTELWIPGNHITSLSPLEGCGKLSILYYKGNPISDYGEVEKKLR
ncbi:MAG: leucine-rich repeat domain-containing protein [Lachnospiraceae bacterium]|nr:leucine-rich repeat domain-containing protein [Lachnospiraceae bacterium]